MLAHQVETEASEKWSDRFPKRLCQSPTGNLKTVFPVLPRARIIKLSDPSQAARSLTHLTFVLTQGTILSLQIEHLMILIAFK
ncbi:hypothetical protein STEG23_033582, partial [Scotinomys teguina]